MKDSAFILLSMTALAFGAPSGVNLFDPAIQFEANFDKDKLEGASGSVNIQSGRFSILAARSNGKVALGMGAHETGMITLGDFGKISIKGVSTMDGMYQAVVESKLVTGQRSLTPMQITVVNGPDGLEYSGNSNLGYLSGTYEGSSGDFVVRLDTDGWITAAALGRYKNKNISWKGYNASINLGIVSAAVNLDDQMKLLDYELGASAGIIHGAMLTNQRTAGRSYRAGVNLGIINFDVFFREDDTKTYSAELDTGMSRFTYNADPKNEKYNWHGSINMANMAIEYAQDNDGLTIGGQIQLGESVISIRRDPHGKFTVKVDRGQMIE